jgi:hypothetical protein
LSEQIECVYLVGCEVSARVKIGRSIDVQARLAALQTMSPVRLTLLWQTLGGAELEALLHRWFDSRRSHGEWFDFPEGDAVAQVVQALPEIAAEMQRVQREQVARDAQQARAEKDAAERAAKPRSDTRAEARRLLKENPDMNAADLARALGRRPQGCYRTLRGEVLKELRDAGELPSVRALGA